jgi:putative FmdB family regulatory protein
MPMREYQCPACGKIEEIHKKIDEYLDTCPKCGNSVKLLLSTSNFNLVGSGFYSVDYGRKDHRKEKPPKETTKV